MSARMIALTEGGAEDGADSATEMRVWLRRLSATTLGGLLLLTLGCARAPFTLESAGGPAWTEARTDHFRVLTDAGEGTAKRLARDLEQTHFLFEKVAFPAKNQPNSVIEVVHFGRKDEFDVVMPSWSQGAFFKRLAAWGGEERILLQGSDPKELREMTRHELSHLFTSFHYPAAPTWLQEGLAQYLELMEVTTSTVRLGVPRKGTYSPSPAYVPTANQLIEMPASVFLMTDSPPGNQRADAGRILNYYGAYSLFRTLIDNQMLRPGLDAYLGELRSRKYSTNEASRLIYDQIDSVLLEQAYAGTLTTSRVNVLVVDRPNQPNPEPSLHHMTDNEVRLLLAQVLMMRPHATTADGWRFVSESQTESPGSETQVAAAQLFLMERNLPAAAREAALAEHDPKTRARALHLSLLAELSLLDLWSVPVPTEKATARLKELQKVANTPDQWAFIARYRLAQGELTLAKRAAERSLNSSASCSAGWLAAAEIFVSEGRLDRARQAYTSAAALFPHGQAPLELTRRQLALEGPSERASSPDPSAVTSTDGNADTDSTAPESSEEGRPTEDTPSGPARPVDPASPSNPGAPSAPKTDSPSSGEFPVSLPEPSETPEGRSAEAPPTAEKP